MSDNTLSIQSSILVAGLALVPGNIARYICLGFLLALLVYHAARRQTPAAKINALTAAIASANELLTRAPSSSASDLSSMHQELLLRLAEKFKSQIQCRLLEIESNGWKEYFRDVRALLKGIDKCIKDIKRIQTNIQLSIEQDTQRKLDDEIQKCRAMLAAIHAGPRRDSAQQNLPPSCTLAQERAQAREFMELHKKVNMDGICHVLSAAGPGRCREAADLRWASGYRFRIRRAPPAYAAQVNFNDVDALRTPVIRPATPYGPGHVTSMLLSKIQDMPGTEPTLLTARTSRTSRMRPSSQQTVSRLRTRSTPPPQAAFQRHAAPVLRLRLVGRGRGHAAREADYGQQARRAVHGGCDRYGRQSAGKKLRAWKRTHFLCARAARTISAW
ncbi:hypothetical protein GGX14DRAFT_570630 [Mycena pura]|uniref:Uncharacterized protein n=1 Tax=Mycena pura TaxID=153505 RepID=A0AAD6V6V8_9AGAR|nr:hypothetical protein GGX14DRAFT_570630 [Mycena pura]